MKLALKFILTAGLSGVFAVATLADGTNPLVKVNGGQISSRLIPSGGAAFKGIPYIEYPASR